MRVTTIETEEDVYKHTGHGKVEDQFEDLEYKDPLEDYITFHKGTVDRLIGHKDTGDLLALYMFYCYTAKWQKTNSVKCTSTYCTNGLGWGKDRFFRTKKRLVELGYIRPIERRNENNQITGHFTQIGFIPKKETLSHSPRFQRVAFPEGGFQDTNALSSGNINALSSGRKYTRLKKSQSDKPPKHKPPGYENISFTKDQFSKLNLLFPKPPELDRCFEILDSYKANSKRRYKEDYSAVRSWVRAKVWDEFRIPEIDRQRRMEECNRYTPESAQEPRREDLDRSLGETA